MRGRRETLAPLDESAFRPHSRSKSRTTRGSFDQGSQAGGNNPDNNQTFDDADESDDDEQDIDEIWLVKELYLTWVDYVDSLYSKTANSSVRFAGGHADIGGGWEIPTESKSASHVPLVYMIREAQKAGLNFDPEKLIEMGVMEALEEPLMDGDNADHHDSGVPDIRIDKSSPTNEARPEVMNWGHINYTGEQEKKKEETESPSSFHQMLHKAHLAHIHDSLEFSSGLGVGQVLSWKISTLYISISHHHYQFYSLISPVAVEYMPFRRMDLQPDGSWKPIRWPLPCGEVRDIPHAARVHGSVIRRLKEDQAYRPGNLIIGGGGRGMRRAPEEYGIGEWKCVQNHGDPIGEVWVKNVVETNGS